MNAALLKQAKQEALDTLLSRNEIKSYQPENLLALWDQVCEDIDQVADLEIELARIPHTDPMRSLDLVAIAKDTAARATLRPLPF